MSHGPISVFSDSIASGASTSGGINLARAWKTVYAEVGTMSTAAALEMQVARASGATFYSVFHPAINSSTVTTNKFWVASGVGTNGGLVPVPNGFQHVRLVATAVVSGGVTVKFVCSD